MDPGKGSLENITHLDKKLFTLHKRSLYHVKGEGERGKHANIFPVGQKINNENFLSTSIYPLEKPEMYLQEIQVF